MVTVSQSQPSAETGPVARPGPKAEEPAAVRLTPRQTQVLRRLAELDAKNALVGFNPCSFGGEAAAASARGLAVRGLVSLSRISERHIRYAITVKGLLALDALASDPPPPSAELGATATDRGREGES